VTPATAAPHALDIDITGLVQGVGFRPFVYRLAVRHGISGWVLNGERGVRVHAEGPARALERFVAELSSEAPPAASIATLTASPARTQEFGSFEIRESRGEGVPTVRVSPDLALCADCRRELFDHNDRRFGYPYINCTNCGPRYSVVLGLPYDRPMTTMRAWPLCAQCRSEYDDPGDRRFHAQPVACAECGPTYVLHERQPEAMGEPASAATPSQHSIERAAALLADGAIVAVKGIGGYHLACDARNAGAVALLRERKYRKERPFALMARNLAVARTLIELDAASEEQLTSVARPIVLAPARATFAGVAPDNAELGVMLPYAPLHELLFAAGAPDVLVMTSANRSSEPIAYDDGDALQSLAGIADAFLIGERPIARRLDDSIVRAGPCGPSIVRRARGLAPQAVALLGVTEPIVAVGADLKNSITLVVGGQAFAGQHIGDLEHFAARGAFATAIADLCAMYGVDPAAALVAHDLHPQYHSSEFAATLSERRLAVQHHRAHVASVLAEREAWHESALGFAFDGTGYGEDGAIWGGEVFSGTLSGGLQRVAHLRTVALPGGDAAARFPEQAAAGFLYGVADAVAFDRAPFAFGARYARARELVAKNVRTFPTSSMGRLFDAVAALLGFTREQTFEGQAPMWLEHLARAGASGSGYAFALGAGDFDSAPVLRAIVADRLAGKPVADIARAFHAAVAGVVVALAEQFAVARVVVSGGVFQNALLVELLAHHFGERLWLNHKVPANDGGISLGQAALAAMHVRGRS
jgi:hydrogenase maturation protein HypF